MSNKRVYCEKPIEAHKCSNGLIRKYPSWLCSMCRPGDKIVNLVMTEADINKVNSAIREGGESEA
jgi:hypothetical protein